MVKLGEKMVELAEKITIFCVQILHKNRLKSLAKVCPGLS